MKKKPLVVGNWKLNGSLALAETMQKNLSGHLSGQIEVVICPPYPYLFALQSSSWALGAQNLALEPKGAYTGEVSASMLVDMGCKYVIIGHSERRAYQDETNEIVGAKVLRALDAGLTPIICIGELEAVYRQGQTISFLKDQLYSLFTLLSSAYPNHKGSPPFILAYEPIWAIGTGLAASPEWVRNTHLALYEYMLESYPQWANTAILYGGSVKVDNVESFVSIPHVGGFLVGGASLEPQTFLTLCDNVSALCP